MYNRQRLDVEIDGQDQTAALLDLPINSMAKNEGNLDDRNYPYSRLSCPTAATPKMATVTAAMLMVREEEGGGR